MTRRLGWSLVALGLMLLAVLAFALSTIWPAVAVIADRQRVGRMFYLPSESMLPTLAVDDRVAPLRVGAEGLRRGDVIVFRGPQTARVDRVVGLPGDRVSIRDGLVSVNGVRATVRSLGAGPTLADGSSTTLTRETLPGEAGSHMLLDAGASAGDDADERVVPPGSIFVLGDNRDRAADSRFGSDVGGVGMVPIDQIIGRVSAIVWSTRSRRWGDRIDTLPISVARRRS